MRRLVIAALLAALVGVPLASAGLRHEAAYPSSIAVLGTATANGWQSDPAHSFQIAPANSWATGTNPAVKSIYTRLLALNPAIKGHNANLTLSDNALEGAGHELEDFAVEVKRAVRLKAKPDLVLVQVIDRAVKCDGTTEQDFAGYGQKFSEALQTLAQGLPNARIFVISQWGSFASYVKYLKGLDAHTARLKNAGKKPCQLVASPSGQLVASRIAYAKRIVAGQQAQLQAACAKVAHCRYDGGAASRIAVTASDLTNFQYTPTIQGQAKLAAAEWKALGGFIKIP
ncbi:MAG TPA: hypothetical protein VFM41_01535 [Gaiella sp.]|jgi:hypothetical protein|nr:hypothetical protein [Gaiella sp.]